MADLSLFLSYLQRFAVSCRIEYDSRLTARRIITYFMLVTVLHGLHIREKMIIFK